MENVCQLKKEDEDDAILRANGHEAAMPRQFNWISALGLGFSITNSWIGYLVSIEHPEGKKKQTILISIIELFRARIKIRRSPNLCLQPVSRVFRSIIRGCRAGGVSFGLSSKNFLS